MFTQQSHGLHGLWKPLATVDDGVVAASTKEDDVAVPQVVTRRTAFKQIPCANPIGCAMKMGCEAVDCLKRRDLLDFRCSWESRKARVLTTEAFFHPT